jgi:hypothetical protein
MMEKLEAAEDACSLADECQTYSHRSAAVAGKSVDANSLRKRKL